MFRQERKKNKVWSKVQSKKKKFRQKHKKKCFSQNVKKSFAKNVKK